MTVAQVPHMTDRGTFIITGISQRSVDHMHDISLMGTRSQFRYHTPVFGVIALRGYNIIEYLAVTYNSR
jgi:hypothetical protein